MSQSRPETTAKEPSLALQTYARILQSPIGQEYESWLKGFTLGPTIEGGMYFSSYVLNKYVLDPKATFLSAARSFSFSGIGPALLSSSIRMSLIYRLQKPALDILDAVYPNKYNVSGSYAISAASAKIATNFLSVIEYQRAYNKKTYPQIFQQLSITKLVFSGSGANVLRDAMCFPLVLKTLEKVEPLIAVNNPEVKAAAAGATAGVAVSPITCLASIVSSHQRKNPGLSMTQSFNALRSELTVSKIAKIVPCNIAQTITFGFLYSVASKKAQEAKNLNLNGDQDARPAKPKTP